uniref:Uncharacterized protein n=1 Tax=Panax quinquefolius TaxID=44588 RepID=A9QW57_PANQU|nr:hypothetical protein LBL10 [Panax quinquefolius]
MRCFEFFLPIFNKGGRLVGVCLAAMAMGMWDLNLCCYVEVYAVSWFQESCIYN